MSLEDVLERVKIGDYSTRDKFHNGTSKGFKSAIWTVCHEIYDELGEKVQNVVYCTKCEKVFKYSRTHGTTTILNHGCLSVPNDQTKIDAFATTTKPIAASDKFKVKESAMSFVAKDIRPFEALNGNGFFQIIKMFVYIGAKYGMLADQEIRALIPSPNTISRAVSQFGHILKMGLYDKIVNIVKKTGIALTTDIWTDNFKRISYLVITAHFVDAYDGSEPVLRDQILSLIPLSVDEKKTGAYLASVIKQTLQKIGIGDYFHKIWFVTDRGLNILNGLKILDIKRLSCFDHLLNNTVGTVCKLPLIDLVLKPVRKLVKFIKIGGHNNKFKKSLKSYAKTRWNTHYDMSLSVDENFEDLDTVLRQLNETNRLTEINRLYLKEIITFLKNFKDISDELEKSLTPTLYLVWPSSVRILRFLKSTRVDSLLLSKMKKKARVYFSKNFVLDKVHRLATILHPQMKGLKFATDEDKLGTIRDLKAMVDSTDSTEQRPVRRRSNESVVSDYFDDDSDLDEVEMYLSYKVPPTDDFDLLKWWEEHRDTFPKLYKISMFIHSIPATSAPSERKFSLAGNILNCLRCSLDPSKIEDLLLIHSNSDLFDK